MGLAEVLLRGDSSLSRGERELIAAYVSSGNECEYCAASHGASAAARAEGATDREIHDTVLIAATFCMFNRYVDGLATPVPDNPAQYAMSAAYLIEHGYQIPR